MYAYNQQQEVRPLHVVPQRQGVRKRIQPKKIRVKKVNPLVALFRFAVVAAFLAAFAVIVFPISFHRLIKQVFFYSDVPLKVSYENTMKYQNPVYDTGVNLYTLANPITNYLNNDLYGNYLLLTPTIQKTHSEVTTMYHTSEMSDLKKQLINLMSQYPSIKPAIYVWEYDKGQYVDINADKIYSAASIIKLPVLVRMFKSIEENQFSIYDEMKMLEQYRSSGSGDLQFRQAGRSYTMDYLAKIMIQDSDNTSTNMIMAKLGGMEDINIGLRDWGISTTYVRTWLPDLGGTNKTTAADIAKILYNLDNPGFLNINSRESIIDYMSHVKNDRLIQAGLSEDALFIHKTGDIGTMLGDAGIVYAPNGKKYIVTILVKRPDNDWSARTLIQDASLLIYNDMKTLL